MKKEMPILFAFNSISGIENDNIKQGIAYSGQVIPILDNIGSLINVIFDLSTMSITEDRYPLLYAHDDKAWVGSFKLINDNTQLSMTDFTLLDNEYAKNIVSAIKKGFPVKTSVRILPKRIEFIENEEVINGLPVKNVYVYRDSTISEVSVTAVPKDANTSLQFTLPTTQFYSFELENTMTESEKSVDIFPDKFAQIERENRALKEEQKTWETRFSQLEKRIAVLQKERDKFAEDAAEAALQLRTNAIVELESLVGEFDEKQKQWLMELDDANFEMFTTIVKEKFEALKSDTCEAEMIEEAAQPQPESEPETQMSYGKKQSKILPSTLFSHQAKGQFKNPSDDLDSWILKRNTLERGKSNGSL